MGARLHKSRRQSGGSGRSPWPPEEFVLYLDENLCNAKAILAMLSRMGVKHERHLDHFPRGTPDHTWLPKVGENRWTLLTADKRIRYNILEKRALAEYRVKEFVFASGNLSGSEMANALERALPRMTRLAARMEPPFVAATVGIGEVTQVGAIGISWHRNLLKEKFGLQKGKACAGSAGVVFYEEKCGMGYI